MAVIAFVLGAGVALVTRWLVGGPTPREVELEALLERERTRFAAHREAVEKHFEQTGQLFQDLSYQHALLYRHLSEGMRGLCANRQDLLGSGLGKTLPGLELQVSDAAPAAAELRPAPPRDEPAV